MNSKIFIGIIAGIAIILSVIAICMDVSEEIVVTDSSLVLGFIGVLATFIVISNAVQLWKFEDRIEQNNNLLKTYTKTIEDIIRQKKKIYNGIKLSILNAVHKEVVEYKFLTNCDKTRSLNSAFLYSMDLIPILEELYGPEGVGKDESGETLDIVIDCFLDLLNADNGKISLHNLCKCRDDLKKFLPMKYYNLENIKKLKQQIEFYISQS